MCPRVPNSVINFEKDGSNMWTTLSQPMGSSIKEMNVAQCMGQSLLTQPCRCSGQWWSAHLLEHRPMRGGRYLGRADWDSPAHEGRTSSHLSVIPSLCVGVHLRSNCTSLDSSIASAPAWYRHLVAQQSNKIYARTPPPARVSYHPWSCLHSRWRRGHRDQSTPKPSACCYTYP